MNVDKEEFPSKVEFCIIRAAPVQFIADPLSAVFFLKTHPLTFNRALSLVKLVFSAPELMHAPYLSFKLLSSMFDSKVRFFNSGITAESLVSLLYDISCLKYRHPPDIKALVVLDSKVTSSKKMFSETESTEKIGPLLQVFYTTDYAFPYTTRPFTSDISIIPVHST